MQSNRIRTRNNGTRDDVVSVHKRTCYWFTNAVNVHWGSTNKSDNEASRCRKKARNHKNAEPTNIKAVVRRSNPGTEIVPQISIRTCSNCSSHLIKRGKYEFGGRTGYIMSRTTLQCRYERCFTSHDPGWRRHGSQNCDIP